MEQIISPERAAEALKDILLGPTFLDWDEFFKKYPELKQYDKK